MKTAELKELAKCQGWELPKDVNEQDTVYVFTESDLDALLKEEAVEFGKHSCSEKDISKQRDIEWNEFYDNWKQLNK